MALSVVSRMDYSRSADGITPTAIQSSIPKPPSDSKFKLPFQQDNNRKYGNNNCGLVNKGNTCYENAYHSVNGSVE